MTNDNIRSELDKQPFIPFRIHLVSGKTVEVTMPGQAEMLQHAVLIFQQEFRSDGERLYEVIALRNIERLEQLGSSQTPPRSGAANA